MARKMDRRKILLLIFDGLGDRPIAELGRQTPLQAARKEHLDWFAANGINGLVDPITPGIRPGSDTSHLALFGYDPVQVYTGRGPFEAAGVGIPVKEGDIAFRGNFATVDSAARVTDRRAGRIRDGTDELAKALDGLDLGGGVRVLFRAGTEHRAAFVLRGPGLSPHVSDPDPHDEGAKVLSAKPTAPDGAATAKARAAVDALKKYDFVVVNVKAPDVCGHDGLASEKVRTVERIDAMMAVLKAGLGPDTVLAATADHSTPVSLKDHSGDPVPVVIFGEGVRVDDVSRFDELSAARGGLGRILGRDLMPILLNVSN